MDSEIIISVNLPGKLGSLIKHTTKQNYAVKITGKNGQPEILIRKILHTDRVPSTCVREIHISPMVIKHWIFGPCPSQINLKTWKKFSNDQKIAAYVNTFDEGYGVSYS